MLRRREGPGQPTGAEENPVGKFSTAPDVFIPERLTFFHYLIKIVNRLSIHTDPATRREAGVGTDDASRIARFSDEP